MPRTNLNARCHVLKFQVHPCVMLLLKGRYVEIGQVWRGEAGSEVICRALHAEHEEGKLLLDLRFELPEFEFQM